MFVVFRSFNSLSTMFHVCPALDKDMKLSIIKAVSTKLNFEVSPNDCPFALFVVMTEHAPTGNYRVMNLVIENESIPGPQLVCERENLAPFCIHVATGKGKNYSSCFLLCI